MTKIFPHVSRLRRSPASAERKRPSN